MRFGFEDDKDEDEEEEETKDPFDGDDDDFDDQDWNGREDLDSDCVGEDEEIIDNEEEEKESSDSDEEDKGENTKQQAEEGRKNHRAFATSDVKRKSGAQAWSNFCTKRCLQLIVMFFIAGILKIFPPPILSKSRILWKGFDTQCPVCQRRGLYAYKDIRCGILQRLLFFTFLSYEIS